MIKINSNIASLEAQRQLGKSSDALAKTFERLGSGLRINHASDDAAGLAVSTTLHATSRLLIQANRNVNDGISLLNIAQGGLEALRDINIRLKELATQSANGIYSSKQREALDNEAQALVSEHTRIIQTTSFNGIKLLNGDATNIVIQASTTSDSASQIALQLSNFSTNSTSTYQSVVTINGASHAEVASGDINGDGILDLITADFPSSDLQIFLGNGDGTFKPPTTLVTGGSEISVSLKDVNGDGKLDIITLGNTTTEHVFLGNGNGSFLAPLALDGSFGSRGFAFGDFNGDGKLDFLSNSSGFFTDYSGVGNGQFTRGGFQFTTYAPSSIAAADLNGDGKLDAIVTETGHNALELLSGDGAGGFIAPLDVALSFNPGDVKTADVNNDGKVDFVVSESGGSHVAVFLNTGSFFTLGAPIILDVGNSPAELTLSDINSDGNIDIVSADSGSNGISIIYGNGNGTFQARTSIAVGVNPQQVTVGDFNGDGKVDLISANSSGSLSISLGIASASSSLSISLLTQSSSRSALDTLDSIATTIEQALGTVGAQQSRLSIASSQILTSRLANEAAYSRITDVDVAEESANIIRYTIQQNVANAILAQANQEPAIILKLLG